MTEPISVFDIFKIGVGPSSSHTMGPWRAALDVLKLLDNSGQLEQVSEVEVLLFGSLAKTGRGHGTDIAVMLGLSGADPVTFDTMRLNEAVERIHTEQCICLMGTHCIAFDPEADIIFRFDHSLEYHPNGMTFVFTLKSGALVEQTYFSVGGGFITKEGETPHFDHTAPPYPFDTAEELEAHCAATGLTIAELAMENEKAWRDEGSVREGLLHIWQVMRDCVYRGTHAEGELPGGLKVTRRAGRLNRKLIAEDGYDDPAAWRAAISRNSPEMRFQEVIKWISCFALAVNEENAAFGRVVTAPTNGAAGVIPAVMMYYAHFLDRDDEDSVVNFLLVAGVIGALFKKGATISAAMGGCQAEIGVSSAMAAAALTEGQGSSVDQALMAAEIAMEHHLGMTCDPVAGLVQIPCIERNSMGAVKAITASNIALESDPDLAKVSLDAVIKTMWQTAQDMHTKYKETSEGGLAISIPVNITEC